MARFAEWLTLIYSGVLSWAMIDLVVSHRLRFYLADRKFEDLVAAGGVLLGILVLLKLRDLLLGGGHAHHHHHSHDEGHDHDYPVHDHGHAHHHHVHDHDHHHHSHDDGHTHHHHAHDDVHDHDHHQPHHSADHSDPDEHSVDCDHGVSLWRYAVLTFPLILLLGGLTPEGLSADVFERRMSRDQRNAIVAIDATAIPGEVGGQGRIVERSVLDLEEAARNTSKRQEWQSTTDPIRVRVIGQYIPDPRFKDRYRVMRIKITCCAADAVPHGVTVVGLPGPAWEYGDWLEITGPVRFVEVTGERSSQFFPVVYAQTAQKLPQPPTDLYLQ